MSALTVWILHDGSLIDIPASVAARDMLYKLNTHNNYGLMLAEIMVWCALRAGRASQSQKLSAVPALRLDDHRHRESTKLGSALVRVPVVRAPLGNRAEAFK